MDKIRPVLIASEETSKRPILIIDKKGKLGPQLSLMVQDQFLTVLVSGSQFEIGKNIIHIPYHKRIPRIPDNHYSHIFVFYNGETEILDMLPALIKKSNAEQGKLLFITSLPSSSSALFQRFSHHAFHGMKILLYGEIFDKEATDHNIVTLFLRQAKKQQRIEVPDSVGRVYPILREDVYETIIATAFGAERKRILLLFPKHPVSELTIARILQKKDPLLRVDFKKYQGNPPHYYIPPDGEYAYPDYPLEEKIRKVASEFEMRSSSLHEKKKQRLAFPKEKAPMKPRYFWLSLLCLLVAPIILAAFAAVVGVATLQWSVREMSKGNLNHAQQYARFASSAFGLAGSIGGGLFYLDPFAKTQKDMILMDIYVGKQLADTENDLLSAMTKLYAISEGKSTAPKSDFLQALAILKNSLITIQRLRAEGDLPVNLQVKLTELSPILLPLENTMDAMPSLLGFEGKRTYLVLFQNNMELRPGGGFIGSYGIVTMEQGRVKQFTISDVYDSDGKLKVHIEPPFALKRYLGVAHWFLRDSNFAIDFPQNAQQATMFLGLETGQKVDGVIAVDTSFLKNILSAIGPVVVTDYKETITADNFYLRTQQHAEKDFFPGSSQKKDFLRALLAAMQQKVADRQNISYQKLIGKVGESIVSKHVLFVFADPASQKLFSVNNLSASLVENRQRGENMFLDFFGVIDANLGANKANYYLKRAIDQQVTLTPTGNVQTTATITYTNSSTKASVFGGDYKNYVRFIVPPNSLVKEIKVNNVKQPTIDAVTDPDVFTAKNFIPPQELEVEHSQEMGRDVIGFLLIVPRESTRELTIIYEAVRAVDVQKSVFSYNLWLFKQPGAQSDPYSLAITYPSTYRVIEKGKELSDVGGKLVYSGQLSEDKELIVELSKK